MAGPISFDDLSIRWRFRFPLYGRRGDLNERWRLGPGGHANQPASCSGTDRPGASAALPGGNSLASVQTKVKPAFGNSHPDRSALSTLAPTCSGRREICVLRVLLTRSVMLAVDTELQQPKGVAFTGGEAALQRHEPGQGRWNVSDERVELVSV